MMVILYVEPLHSLVNPYSLFMPFVCVWVCSWATQESVLATPMISSALYLEVKFK